jgi:hypothetical protein
MSRRNMSKKTNEKQMVNARPVNEDNAPQDLSFGDEKPHINLPAENDNSEEGLTSVVIDNANYQRRKTQSESSSPSIFMLF